MYSLSPICWLHLERPLVQSSPFSRKLITMDIEGGSNSCLSSGPSDSWQAHTHHLPLGSSIGDDVLQWAADKLSCPLCCTHYRQNRRWNFVQWPEIPVSCRAFLFCSLLSTMDFVGSYAVLLRTPLLIIEVNSTRVSWSSWRSGLALELLVDWLGNGLVVVAMGFMIPDLAWFLDIVRGSCSQLLRRTAFLEHL